MSKIQQETSASVIAGGLIDEQSEIREAISMALSTSLQVTRNFGNLYTVNKNVFKFVNQGIITFHRTSEFEYRKINNLKCILFMNKKKNVL